MPINPDLLDEEEEIPTAGAGMALPPAAAAESEGVDEEDDAPATPTLAPVQTDKDFLRQYFANQMLNRERLSRAEDTADSNRLYARLGGAASTIAAGIARAPQVPDQSAFEGMAKDADVPVKTAERGITNQLAGDRILRDYFTRQATVKQKRDQMEQKAETSRDWQALKDAQNKETERHHRATENRPQKDPSAAFIFRDAQLAKREHAKLMSRIDRDPTLRNQMSQVTNMKNAMAATENAAREGKPITKQQFEETQQAVIASLGLKGQQSVGERERKFFDSVGINGQAALQFLTGQPQDIGKDNPLYQHIRDLARWESKNVADQYQEQLDNITAGNGWIYDENPKLKADLEKKVRQLTGAVRGRQFAADETGAHGSMPAAGAPPKPGKSVMKREYSPSRGKTRITYSDGTQEIVDGR